MYWSTDNKKPWDYRNIEGPKYSTYISYLISAWSLDDKSTKHNVTTQTSRMVARSFNDDLKIETLFGIYWSFRWLLRLVACWWFGKWWTGCWWACGPNFWGEIKKVGCWIDSKNILLNFMYKIERMLEIPRKSELS